MSLEPADNSPEDLMLMKTMVEGFTKWSVERMNDLTANDRIDDATAIYYEFEEWINPDEFNDVVVIDDMNFDE